MPTLPAFSEQPEKNVDEATSYREEALMNELETLKVKHKIYSADPEMKDKADDYLKRIKSVTGMLVGMQKNFRQAKAAENIHAAQGSASGVSRAFEAIAESKTK